MSFLYEDNYIDIINGYTLADWQSLLDLIPDIENTKEFSVLTDSGYYEEVELIYRFRDFVYHMPIIIVFDWSNWDEGRAIVNDKNFDFTSIDIPTKCKLITAFIRNDRFAEGALANSFKSGTMLQILKAIKAQVK